MRFEFPDLAKEAMDALLIRPSRLVNLLKKVTWLPGVSPVRVSAFLMHVFINIYSYLWHHGSGRQPSRFYFQNVFSKNIESNHGIYLISLPVWFGLMGLCYLSTPWVRRDGWMSWASAYRFGRSMNVEHPFFLTLTKVKQRILKISTCFSITWFSTICII